MSYKRDPFVNRGPQVKAFRDRLQGRGKQLVLFYRGKQGAGKTTLLARLRKVCQDQERTCTLLELWHDGLSEPEDIIECLCKRIPDLGQSMEPEREAVSLAFPEQVALGGLLSGQMGAGPSFPPEPAPGSTYTATMGDVTKSIIQTGEGNAVFYNSPIYFPPEWAAARTKKERVRLLSAVLREKLRQLADREMVVLLFDGCDEAPEKVRKWLRIELLDPFLEGSLPFPPNLVIVLAGDPTCDKGIWLNSIASRREEVDAHDLGNLPPEAVREYWVEIRELDETRLWEAIPPGGAFPLLMVMAADSWEAAK